MKVLREQFAVVALVAVVLGAGCTSKSRPSLVPVKGIVKLDGKPMDNVQVCFCAADPTGDAVKDGYAVAYTDANGAFSLRDVYGQEGIYAGKYKVIFSRFVDRNGKPIAPDSKPAEIHGARDSMPVRYQSQDSTPELVEVPSSGLEVVFDLTAK